MLIFGLVGPKTQFPFFFLFFNVGKTIGRNGERVRELGRKSWFEIERWWAELWKRERSRRILGQFWALGSCFWEWSRGDRKFGVVKGNWFGKAGEIQRAKAKETEERRGRNFKKRAFQLENRDFRYAFIFLLISIYYLIFHSLLLFLSCPIIWVYMWYNSALCFAGFWILMLGLGVDIKPHIWFLWISRLILGWLSLFLSATLLGFVGKWFHSVSIPPWNSWDSWLIHI